MQYFLPVTINVFQEPLAQVMSQTQRGSGEIHRPSDYRKASKIAQKKLSSLEVDEETGEDKTAAVEQITKSQKSMTEQTEQLKSSLKPAKIEGAQKSEKKITMAESGSSITSMEDFEEGGEEGAADAKTKTRKGIQDSQLRDSLIAEIRTFIESLNWTIEHLEDDIQLPVTEFPDIFYISDEIIVKNPKMVQALEEVIMSWERHITKLIETYTAKVRLCFFSIKL